MYNYAGIVINNESIQLDRFFTYRIPDKLKDSIKKGFRVKVPFGVSNKKVDGFVMELYEDIDDKIGRIKDIICFCENFPLLQDKDIFLIKLMKEKYICTYLECIKVFLPTGIIKGVKEKKQKVIYCIKPLDSKYHKEPYIRIYETVQTYNGILNKNQLSCRFEFSLSSINTLIKHGFLVCEEKKVERFSNREYPLYPSKTLNSEQNNALNSIIKGGKKKYLIHGVTGSGKTEIYMHLVSEMIRQDKDTIILVPEISLTPQIVERFKGRFGNNIAVFHSKLSDGERYDEWFRVCQGNVKVAIGARSAVFLPFNNLGLIIIDEEHEGSYKSDSNPKYNAREIAEMRCEIENSKLVLGSATPSVETYYRCKKGEIELITITHRADGAVFPEINIIDMREELCNNNRSIFSNSLYEGIKARLNKKEQIMLFLNRRGFSTFVSCRKCGYVFKCDKCDISLTYHNDEKALLCHYCGTKQSISRICPKCGSKYVKYFGIGTEKVEEEVKKYFPDCKTVRMDFDTTRKKDSYENIYRTFKNGKADILIGTQMIAKGLDFHNVTLVGIIAADMSLNLPDYRSGERTFQLITQVSGRAGRGQKKGEVIIQTYNPDNYTIKYSSSNDYINFFNHELGIRESMNYPPFSKILCINISSKNEDLLIKSIQSVGINLKNILKNSDKIEMLGPCPCEISKIKDLYRWQIILKGDFNYEFAYQIKKSIYELLKDVYNEIRVSMDINPNSLL